MKYIFILLILTVFAAQAQQKYIFKNYSVTFAGSVLELKKGDNLEKEFKFINPASYSADLDNDGLEDFLVTDRLPGKSSDMFTMYIFNTIDSFYITDSIHSGYTEPYFTTSNEIGEMIIVAGNEDFMYLEAEESGFLPINCYKYESGEILQINDELYDIFITENEGLIEYIDEYFVSNVKNCYNTERIISAIASAYANYINAGEPTLAHQLITNYYFCDNKDKFVNELNALTYNWKDTGDEN
jgi:hypothetical protein